MGLERGHGYGEDALIPTLTLTLTLTLPLPLILTLTLTLIRRAARRPRPLLRMGGTTAVRYAACRRTRARLTAPRVVRAPTGARRRRRRRRWRQGQAHEAPGRRSSVGGRLRAAAGVTEKRDSGSGCGTPLSFYFGTVGSWFFLCILQKTTGRKKAKIAKIH